MLFVINCVHMPARSLSSIVVSDSSNSLALEFGSYIVYGLVVGHRPGCGSEGQGRKMKKEDQWHVPSGQWQESRRTV